MFQPSKVAPKPRGALKTFMEILNGQVISPGDCMLKQAVKMKRLQEEKEGSKIYLGFFFFFFFWLLCMAYGILVP